MVSVSWIEDLDRVPSMIHDAIELCRAIA